MNEDYNLKKIMNEVLEDITVNNAFEESIKVRCLEKSKFGNRIYKSLAKVAVWILGVVCVLSGTAYALSHIDGFSKFIDNTTLQKIAPHIQTINKGDGDASIKMIVEAAITDHFNSLLVFSFINEGEEPWIQGIEAGRWMDSWNSVGTYMEPTLSPDGKKLTYYIEGFNNQDILKGKELELKAENLIVKKEVEEEIDIDLGELFNAHGIVVDTKDYNYSHTSDDIFMKLKSLLEKKVGNSQEFILNKEDEITFKYMGMVKDSLLRDTNNPEGGLTFYTRSKSNRPWTGRGDGYTVGYISEVTDTRTGKVYEVTGRRLKYDMLDSVFEGALGISTFRELNDPRAIPYLKATKVMYEVQEVVVKDKWHVKFKLQDTTTMRPVQLDLNFKEGNESVNIKRADFSVFGVTLQGTRMGKLEDRTQDSIYEKMVVKLRMKDGTIIDLNGFTMTGRKEKFTSSYMVLSDDSERIFLNVDEIESIIINGEETSIN